MDIDKSSWQNLMPNAKKVELHKKQVVLQEGEISKAIIYVETGCLRSWYNHDGKDVSLQFFLEGQMVSSLENFKLGLPSQFTLEALLPSTVYILPKDEFEQLLTESIVMKDLVLDMTSAQLIHYQHLFLSRIKDSPQQRYEALVKEQPELIKLIPQHYIASYLGITSVSLSRIRCRK